MGCSLKPTRNKDRLLCRFVTQNSRYRTFSKRWWGERARWRDHYPSPEEQFELVALTGMTMIPIFLFFLKRWHLLFRVRCMKCRIKFPSSEYQDRKSIRMIPIFNIERQFCFYGAYRNNKWNILVHVLFVWPMVVGLLVLLAYSPVLYPNPPWFSYLPIQITQHMVFNYSFVAACTYAVFYISLDHRAGFLAAFLVMGSWMGANAVAKSLPWDKAWKVNCSMAFMLWKWLQLIES